MSCKHNFNNLRAKSKRYRMGNISGIGVCNKCGLVKFIGRGKKWERRI